MSGDIPAQMQALIVKGKSQVQVETVETPKAGPGEILVKVSHVALNPTDWKGLDLRPNVGATLGNDYSGTVAATGEGVEGINVGDRVAGSAIAAQRPGGGAFAEYHLTNADGVVALPSSIDDAHGANLGVGGMTAYFGLYQPKHLGLPEPARPLKSLPPVDPNFKVLVWSGATSVGQYAIGFARASGAYVIATGSAKNHELLNSLGASEVYDYHDQQTAEKIAALHPDLTIAYDTFSEKGSQEACARALSKEKPSKLVIILPPAPSLSQVNPKVEVDFILLYSVRGEPFEMAGHKFSREYCQDDRRYLFKMLRGKQGDLYKVLQNGLVKPNHPTVLPGGLAGIPEGLDRLRKGQVSGEKLTYKIS